MKTIPRNKVQFLLGFSFKFDSNVYYDKFKKYIDKNILKFTEIKSKNKVSILDISIT